MFSTTTTRTIDDDAEVDGAQAQQRAGDAGPPHAAKGEQHRQRDGQRHDQPGPQVAEKEEHDCRSPAAPPSSRLLRTVAMT